MNKDTLASFFVCLGLAVWFACALREVIPAMPLLPSAVPILGASYIALGIAMLFRLLVTQMVLAFAAIHLLVAAMVPHVSPNPAGIVGISLLVLGVIMLIIAALRSDNNLALPQKDKTFW